MQGDHGSAHNSFRHFEAPSTAEYTLATDIAVVTDELDGFFSADGSSEAEFAVPIPESTGEHSDGEQEYSTLNPSPFTTEYEAMDLQEARGVGAEAEGSAATGRGVGAGEGESVTRRRGVTPFLPDNLQEAVQGNSLRLESGWGQGVWLIPPDANMQIGSRRDVADLPAFWGEAHFQRRALSIPVTSGETVRVSWSSPWCTSGAYVYICESSSCSDIAFYGTPWSRWSCIDAGRGGANACVYD